MKQFLTIATAALALLVSPAPLSAHDDRLHGPNALTGELVASTADGLSLKTKTDTVKVRFSSKTTFEHVKKAVDKTHVRQGDLAGVIGSKLPSGEWMANEVILGLPAPKAATDTKKDAEKKATDLKR